MLIKQHHAKRAFVIDFQSSHFCSLSEMGKVKTSQVCRLLRVGEEAEDCGVFLLKDDRAFALSNISHF